MSELLKFREARNMTQEELSKSSGISVRTIQRVEAGTVPKGHSLKALAKALNVEEAALLPGPGKSRPMNIPLMKLINLSSLPASFLPPFNILIPLTIIFLKKEVNPLSRQLITVQILWALAAAFLFLFSAFLGKWLSLGRVWMPAIMLFLALSNVLIILRNAAELDKHGKLYIRFNFNII